MRYTIYQLFAVFFLAIGHQTAIAQLVLSNTAPNNSPEHLVKNVFMGGGIEAMNFSFNGSTAATTTSGQVGYFSGGGNIFNIDSGIVMSTGHINNINGGFGTIGNFGSDADVLAVSQSVPWGNNPTSMNQCAVLEFDFVAPQSDSLVFEYVFGSVEWPTYPCSVFNDAFGFFISGPGINGTYSNNAVNVSIIPGTTLPVAITSIHNGTGSSPCNGNPSYNQYLNVGPSTYPFIFAGTFSGAYTDVFETKKVWVNACDTYHVKLAICDGTDTGLDSGVFLKARSFKLSGMTVNPQPSYNPFSFDTALYEGCGTLDILFERSDTILPAYTVNYEIGGTSTMGADYSMLPNCGPLNPTTQTYPCTVSFPQDCTTVELNIDILLDAAVEGIETFVFMINDSNVINCYGGDTLEMTILDQPDLQIQTYGNTSMDCNDPPTEIGVNISGSSLPPFDIAWSTGQTSNSFNVSPATTSSYTVTVTDGCGTQVETGFVTVGVFNPPWTVSKFGDEQTINCTSAPVKMGVNVAFTDGAWHGDIHYNWSTGSTDSTITVFSNNDTSYSITITRPCANETVVKHFDLYVHNDPVTLSAQDISSSAMECPGDSVTISVQAQGGYPPYTYLWENGDSDSTTYVFPMSTDNFEVTVQDVCGLKDYVTDVVVNVPVPEPLQILGITDDTIPCPDILVHYSTPVPKGGFGYGYIFSWDNWKTRETEMEKIIMHDDSFTVQLTDVCRFDTVSKTVHVKIMDKTDLELLLPSDTVICQGDSIDLAAQGINGGGEYFYEWDKSFRGPVYRVAPQNDREFHVRMIDNCDSIRRGSVHVEVNKVFAEFEYEYLEDYVVRFINNSRATDSITGYTWSLTGTDNVQSHEYEPIIELSTGDKHTAELLVRDELGCVDIARAVISPAFYLYIPTGFTPNSDNINEKWAIEGVGIKEFEIRIFDRWGQLVFHSNDKNFQWDGKLDGKRLPMGTYAYKLSILTDTNEYIDREGTVSILNDFQPR